jgi:branched-chain amino acid transport system substrate-binding protein
VSAVVTPAHRVTALVGAAVLVAAGPLLTGCTASASRAVKAPATVTIGLLAATSGDAAAGRPAAQGAELAVEVVNAAYPDITLPFAPSAGLSRGTKLRLVIGDTKGDAEAATRAADQIVREAKPAGVVVADSADVVKAVGQRTDTAGTPLVDACSSADYLNEIGRESYFRIGPTDRTLLTTALDALRQGPPSLRKLLVLDGASGKGLGGAPGLAEIAQARGFAVVGRLPVNPGGNAAELAEKIGLAKPDAVLGLVGTEQEAAAVADVGQRLKGNLPVVALGQGAHGLGAAAATTGRMMRAASWSSDFAGRNPVAKAVGDLYQRRYGSPMNDAAASVFTAVLTLAVAIDGAGSGQPLRVRAILSETRLQATETIMPWNGIRFDTGGQNLLAAGVVEQGAANGFQVAFPRELAPRGGSS